MKIQIKRFSNEETVLKSLYKHLRGHSGLANGSGNNAVVGKKSQTEQKQQYSLYP